MRSLFQRLLVPALVVLPLAILGCRSGSDNASAVEIPCTCGTPEAALQGCAHPTCLAGETNSDNEDCVCGTLSIPQ